MLKFDHVAIQTHDIENTVKWYKEFFNCQENWALNKFSPLTIKRLPSITQLVELQVGNFRLHIFDIKDDDGIVPNNVLQYQHFCIEVLTLNELEDLRSRYCEIYQSGRYEFRKNEPATDLVIDDDGMTSFYCYDINGLEFEITYKPSINSNKEFK
ncbi:MULTISPECIES: VOC family protein [Cyanophyceae]|jgi:hypothetical protein|uniref:VOC family protein n=1 Tax=Cyanophyceae TaxID=3028117 RepID=UPI0008011BD4|nr:MULTISPECIES: VOC family protein [Cyanophyceae]MCA2809718.1 VOC family protein [Microcystis sp. M095S1]MCZ2207448.1 VOC family protein [Cylindrospermopsis raciborskii PAMP2011]OBQ36371.1 MAG: hypothetical protein AN487_13145 [Anabaena sp. CRKS33]